MRSSFRTRAVILLTFAAVLATSGCAMKKARGDAFEFRELTEPGNGLVYLYRPPQRWAEKANIVPDVLVNGASIGALRYRGFVATEVGPGQHTLTVTGISPRAEGWRFEDRELKFLLKAGETRYFRLIVQFDMTNNTVLGGALGHHVFLQPVDRDIARLEIYDTRASN